MFEYIYPTYYIQYQYKINKVIKTAFKKYYDNYIKIIWVDDLKCHYNLILVDIIINKQQIFITKIKANMQYSVCYISSQE